MALALASKILAASDLKEDKISLTSTGIQQVLSKILAMADSSKIQYVASLLPPSPVTHPCRCLRVANPAKDLTADCCAF